MNVLAFDTSTAMGGVAVLKDGAVLASRVWSREISHGELLTSSLEAALTEAKLKPADLNVLAIGNGPGSFTGVRIAVNAARSLAFALKIPVHVFDSAEILAAQVDASDLPIAVLINAHKNLAFYCAFDLEGERWKRRAEIRALTVDEIEVLVSSPHLCLGDGFDAFKSTLSQSLKANLIRDSKLGDFPLPITLGLLVHREKSGRKPLVWNEVQALYIRASGAEEKLQESRGPKS